MRGPSEGGRWGKRWTGNLRALGSHARALWILPGLGRYKSRTYVQENRKYIIMAQVVDHVWQANKVKITVIINGSINFSLFYN